jgi:aminoglycoside phosphotransferase (APT) family kinase protein
MIEHNHALALREAAAVASHGNVLADHGVDGFELCTRMGTTVEAAIADAGGSSIMHGDAHPGNVFWDPVRGVCLIDTPHSHFSFDKQGRPIGTPARDYANMTQRLGHFGREAGLNETEVQELQASFVEAYAAAGGPSIPRAAVKAYAARFATRDALDSFNAMKQPDDEQAHDKLRLQLRDEVSALRRVLDWTA